MNWEYPATIWTLDPSDLEGWVCRKGKLIYCDSSFAKVQTPEGIFEAPLHCVYVQAPLVWFIDAVRRQNLGTGKYGSGLSGTKWNIDDAKIAIPNNIRSKSIDRRSKSDEEDIFGE
jgi:hypothetical protein